MAGNTALSLQPQRAANACEKMRVLGLACRLDLVRPKREKARKVPRALVIRRVRARCGLPGCGLD